MTSLKRRFPGLSSLQNKKTAEELCLFIDTCQIFVGQRWNQMNYSILRFHKANTSRFQNSGVACNGGCHYSEVHGERFKELKIDISRVLKLTKKVIQQTMKDILQIDLMK